MEVLKMEISEKQELRDMILDRVEQQDDCEAWNSMSSGDNPKPIPFLHPTYGWIHPREFLYEYSFGKVPGEITMSCGNRKCINVEHMVVAGFNVEAGQSQFMPINNITQNIDTQPRAVIYGDTVDSYAESMLNGEVFPPVELYFDGSLYWLADGYHRVRAAEQANIDKLRVIVHQGTKRDAMLHSFGANATHGLRRTNEDIRRAVTRLITDDEWSTWSHRRLAAVAGVNHMTIKNWRDRLDANPDQREYIDQAGNLNTWEMERVMDDYVEQLAEAIVEEEPVPGIKSMHADRVRQLVDYFGESAQTIIYLSVNRLFKTVFEDGEIIDADAIEEVR